MKGGDTITFLFRDQSQSLLRAAGVNLVGSRTLKTMTSVPTSSTMPAISSPLFKGAASAGAQPGTFQSWVHMSVTLTHHREQKALMSALQANCSYLWDWSLTLRL